MLPSHTKCCYIHFHVRIHATPTTNQSPSAKQPTTMTTINNPTITTTMTTTNMTTTTNRPFVLNTSWSTPLIPKKNGSSWIENPIVSTLPAGRFATVFDWVQGGGAAYGAPLPYLGFSWSDDGITWPEKNGELISVVPSDPKTPHWTVSACSILITTNTTDHC